jgi:hypothetical protein
VAGEAARRTALQLPDPDLECGLVGRQALAEPDIQAYRHEDAKADDDPNWQCIEEAELIP